jgi:hypothetical protein
VILNWVLPAARIAKNIFYLKMPSTFVTSDPAALAGLAEQVKGAFLSSNPYGNISSTVSLQSVTCKDNAGTTAQGSSSSAAQPGTNVAASLPPQVSICISWQIAESYRGGKPRWYLPGIPTTAVTPAGSSTVDSAYAGQLEAKATALMAAINGLVVVGGGTLTFGTISYHTGHALRPTPQFRTFINAKVHERLDSQRRRSGPESAFGVIP